MLAVVMQLASVREEHTSELQSHDNLVCRFCCVLLDRKSTRLNSSHTIISYAVFCLKKKVNSSHNTDTIWAAPRSTSHAPVVGAGGGGAVSGSGGVAGVIRSWPGGLVIFFFNDTATTEIYTLSLHALFRSSSSSRWRGRSTRCPTRRPRCRSSARSSDRKSTRLNSRHTIISYAVFLF